MKEEGGMHPIWKLEEEKDGEWVTRQQMLEKVISNSAKEKKEGR